MRVAQVPTKGAKFEIVKRDIPHPGPGEVLIKVEACGICHSDVASKEGLFPGVAYPIIPGHEIVGKIAKVGEGVTLWKEGQRVGAGWHGGHCFICNNCRRGDFIMCDKEQMTGVTRDGGYAEYMLQRAEAVCAIPDGISPEHAAPLLCAGITVFNSLRHSGAHAGDVVAVQGIGGLGHLGVQYANKMGFKTVVLSSSADKKDLSFKLGAHVYLDSSKQNIPEELQKLGGAKVLLATAPNADLISSAIDGLSVGGQVLVLAVDPNPIKVSTMAVIGKRRRVQGWPSGTSMDWEDTLNFSVLHNILPMIEVFPLEEVEKAFHHALSNKARFRVVLSMEKKQ